MRIDKFGGIGDEYGVVFIYLVVMCFGWCMQFVIVVWCSIVSSCRQGVGQVFQVQCFYEGY